MPAPPDAPTPDNAEIEFENREWRASLAGVHRRQGPERVRGLPARLREYAQGD